MPLQTQLDQVKSEIVTLEIQLAHATLNSDAFSQMQIYKELQAKKSFKDTLEWM
jgi:hypothetical protein|tara:strand:+ start:276 stop:437 length:162 start_codon:yes stop_codon:yes gene_type:complete